MQGEYKVDFDFKETTVLASDYTRFPTKKTGVFETVIVVESLPKFVVLQHILVVGDGQIVKHWRQDWPFEADKRFEFTVDQTWQIKTITETKRRGFWTQCVYEVSDAPRCCGTGRWNHRYGVSTWTSDRSWRPLPRREYTVRDDYNALNVENRHTVTTLGWTHEQDNTKVQRIGSTTQDVLVREFGFNDYRRISDYDFTPTYQYWEKTAPYWSSVRAAWSVIFSKKKQIILNTTVDGMPIIQATFAQAEAIEKGEPPLDKKTIEKVLSQWVNSGFEQTLISL